MELRGVEQEETGAMGGGSGKMAVGRTLTGERREGDTGGSERRKH